MYEERNSQVELRLEEVKLGTALEYTQPLEELHQNLKNRLEVAGNIFVHQNLKNRLEVAGNMFVHFIFPLAFFF